MPNGRCRMPAGKPQAGIASPRFPNGPYSRYLPERLIGRYTEAESDEKLLELRADIALVDARLADLLGRLDSGESRTVWQRLREAQREFTRARRSGATEEMRAALLAIDELIAQGASEASVWEDVLRLLDQRRRLVESERRRLVEMGQMITTERAMVLLGVVVATIRRHVTDRAALAAISSDLRQLVAQ